jgi:hypothetical protein
VEGLVNDVFAMGLVVVPEHLAEESRSERV